MAAVNRAPRLASPARDAGRPVRALLLDGTVVRLRELDETDAPLVSALYRQLPVYDRFLRFFSAGVLPAMEDVIARRGPGDVSLGAFRGETLIGVAQCLATGDDPPTAEVALAVAHAEQANGVGTLLLDHLASRARRNGMRRFVAEVLAENDRVRQVLADVGLPVRRWVEDGQVQVEFDLDPEGGYLDALAAREERADVASLTAVLAPRSVIVVGAGRRHDSVGHVVLRNLVQVGYRGRLAAVNPHATRVCGVVCLRSVDELTEPVDLAVLCVPSSAVPTVAEQCGRKGVRALLVISSGLSGEPALATGLLDAVRRHDMRAVGPNCLGIANTDPVVRLDATFAEPAPRGAGGPGHAVGRGRGRPAEGAGPAGAGRVDCGVDGGQVRRQRQRHAVVVARRRTDPGGGAAPGVVRQPAQVLPLRPKAGRAHAGAQGPVGQLRGRAAGCGVAHCVHGHSTGDP